MGGMASSAMYLAELYGLELEKRRIQIESEKDSRYYPREDGHITIIVGV
jgi:hypothetical protein